MRRAKGLLIPSRGFSAFAPLRCSPETGLPNAVRYRPSFSADKPSLCTPTHQLTQDHKGGLAARLGGHPTGQTLSWTGAPVDQVPVLPDKSVFNVRSTEHQRERCGKDRLAMVGMSWRAGGHLHGCWVDGWMDG